MRQIVKEYGFEVVETNIVADEEKFVRNTVKRWSQLGSIDWIITIGGTGFGVRDRTPEASRAICLMNIAMTEGRLTGCTGYTGP